MGMKAGEEQRALFAVRENTQINMKRAANL